MPVAIKRVHYQCSSDYQTEPRFETLLLSDETTVAEIMEWSERHKGLGEGDLIIAKTEEPGDMK